jgi:hypothetical protein
MESIDKKIVSSQLREMGLGEKAKPGVRLRERQVGIMDDDYEERRPVPMGRKTVVRADSVQTQRSNRWHRDQVCERLGEFAKGWRTVDGDAVMSQREFDLIVTTLATDFANAMEHAGLIYKTRIAPSILADMVSDFLTTQTKVLIGNEYYDLGMGG